MSGAGIRILGCPSPEHVINPRLPLGLVNVELVFTLGPCVMEAKIMMHMRKLRKEN